MIEPFFSNSLGTIYCGDLFEVLPGIERESIDLLVFDPPYGKNYKSNRRTARPKRGAIAGDDGSFPLSDALAEALKVLRNSRHIYCFGISEFPKQLKIGGNCALTWDKGEFGAGDLSIPFGLQHEPLMFGVRVDSAKNRERGDGALAARLRRGSILKGKRTRGYAALSHTTEKPVEILRQIIESSSMIGETVLDITCGAGSTLIAAALEGRRGIGIDISPEECKKAAKKLRRLESMLRRFTDSLEYLAS